MKVADNETVDKLAKVLRAAKIDVPENITPQMASALVTRLKGRPSLQQAAIHLLLHVYSEHHHCEEEDGNRQIGQDDPKSEQAAQ